MPSRRIAASAIALGLAAISSTAFGYGEPAAQDAPSLPSHEERLLHVFTNQVRQEPHAWPGWDTSLSTPEARLPLLLDSGLVEAARFHADDMAKNGFFAHDSFDGTTFQNRITRYFHGSAGENIYTATFQVGAKDAITAWMTSAGHRVNILTPSWRWFGPGFSIRASQRYYVQDFGGSREPMIPAIPGAALEPSGGGKLRLYANYYDQRGRAPKSVTAVLAKVEIPLQRIAGHPGNTTHAAMANAPAGCESLYFVAVDADSGRTVYPTRGVLLAGAGCTEAYTADQANGSSPGDKRPMVEADKRFGCTCLGAQSRSAIRSARSHSSWWPLA